MPDFDESVFDAMTDEALAVYLAHDAELPLSFVRSADSVLYAATLLALRRADTLPDPAAAFERFQSDYLPVPFDGATLWDDQPRFAPAPSVSPRPARPTAKAAVSEQPPPLPQTRETPLPMPPAASPMPSAALYTPPAVPRRGRGAALLVLALIALTAALGVAFIGSTFRALLGFGPAAKTDVSPATPGYTLTWVPAGYSSADFSDWDVSGYLYTWKNSAGDTITFCRYHKGTNIAVEQEDAEVSEVTVCGVTGEYTRHGREHSLVFSDPSGENVYYLTAGSVTDSDMNNMMAAIK